MPHLLEGKLGEPRREADPPPLDWLEEILNQVVDAAENGVFQYRFDTGEIRLDRRAQKVLSGLEDGGRIDPAACLNRIYPDDREETARAVTDLRQGRTDRLRLKIRFETENRRYSWIVLRGKLFDCDPDGRPLRMVGIVIETLDTDQIQKEVLKSHGMFRNIVENMPVLFDAFDGNGVALFWNRECERVTGYGSEEIVGNPRAMELIYPDPEVRRSNIEKSLQSDGSFRDWETEIRCKDGESRTIAWSGISREHPIPGWWSWGIGMDVTERKRMEKQIKAALTEKEILLKEVHHRVKNNMQIISSLLNLQAAKDRDPKVAVALRECQRRVAAMALVHESIYRSETLGELDLGAYIGGLVRYMTECFGLEQSGIRIGLEVRDPIQVGVDQAVSCGLVLNELLCNALEHAFPDGGPGVVKVSAELSPQAEIRLEVRDTGVGLPPDFDPEPKGSLGISLVANLVKHQLRGRLKYESDPGAAFIVEFKPTAKRSEHFPVR